LIIFLETSANSLNSSPEVTDFLRFFQAVIPVPIPVRKDVTVPGLLKSLEGKHRVFLLLEF
jgi:hypothetical protein